MMNIRREKCLLIAYKFAKSSKWQRSRARSDNRSARQANSPEDANAADIRAMTKDILRIHRNDSPLRSEKDWQIYSSEIARKKQNTTHLELACIILMLIQARRITHFVSKKTRSLAKMVVESERQVPRPEATGCARHERSAKND